MFYYGTFAIIGLSSSSGYYIEFIHRYCDYTIILKNSLLKGAGIIAGIFGYETVYESGDLIRVVGQRGVKVAISCLGIGVMSFWAAFIISSNLLKKMKVLWLSAGLIILWIINICRIGIFLVSINKGWSLPFGLDHHTWFNILAYSAIFCMIYLFEKLNSKIE